MDEGIALQYHGARFYDQDIGIWISPDAMRQFHSLYSYTGNGYNPINGTDPDGNEYNQTGKEIYRFARENNFWGSEKLANDLTLALVDPFYKYNVEWCTDCGPHKNTNTGVIKIPEKYKGTFESARQLRHENKHVKGRMGPIEHNYVGGGTFWDRLIVNFISIFKPEALAPEDRLQPDYIYLDDLKVIEQAGKQDEYK